MTSNLRSRMPMTWALLALGTASGSQALMAQVKGPSSSETPYVLPLQPSVATTSVLTVGDSVNNKPDGTTPYRMVGIPDGMGAYDNGDDTFTVLLNHELGETQGVVRAHGSIGSFVSKWIIRKDNLQVLRGEDLIQRVVKWNALTSSYDAPSTGPTNAIRRLCSADLPELSAFYSNGVGFNGRIFMSGEETGSEGRAFGHVVTGGFAGTSYDLPRLGKFSWENSLAHPTTGLKTVVVGTDDSTPGEVYIYVGTKTNAGSPVERAGLTNGTLYGVAVQGLPSENRNVRTPDGTPFTLAPLGNVENKTGAQLQTDSTAAGVTKFLRPEDGFWDPNNPNHFYFVTTDQFDTVKTGQGTQVGRSRMWRLRFQNAAQPELGGQIDMVLDGTGDYQMMDNMVVDVNGRAIVQEDPGGQAYTARIQEVDLRSGTVTPLAQHDPARFGSLTQAPSAGFNNDEESSGVIDISDILGRNGYLINVQAHFNLADPELVQKGQLLVMSTPSGNPSVDLDAAASGIDATASFTEDGGAIAIARADALVEAGRGGSISGLTVTLSNRPDGSAESLSASVGTTGLTASYNAATGVLSISGTGTPAAYTQVLRSVRYNNTSQNPSTAQRLVVISANDGVFVSDSATSAISVAAVNDAPSADVDVYTVAEDATLTVRAAEGVLVGDADAEDQSLTAQVVDRPAKGRLDFNADGSFSYQPNANFNGSDFFTYRAGDGSAQSAATRVNLTVSPVNDAPIAQAQSLAVAEDGSVAIVLSGTDADGGALSYRVVTQPVNGTLSGTGANLTYRPRANFTGEDAFAFVARDGQVDSAPATVALRVGMTNDAPTAGNDSFATGERVLRVAAPGLLANDRDADGDNLSITVESQPQGGTLSLLASGAFTYIPRPGFGGSDSFTYRVSDGRSQSNLATVRVQVGAAIDVTPPQIRVASPAPGAAYRTFPQVQGVAIDGRGDASTGATEPSGIREVRASILRVSDRMWWNGRAWTSAFTILPTRVVDGLWTVTAPLPSGSALLQGRYLIVSGAVDNAGNARRADSLFTIDTQAPQAFIDSPRNGARLTVGQLTNLSGRATDFGSGVALVRVFLRRGDGQFWNGRGYQIAPFGVVAARQGGRYSISGNLPAGSNLAAGNYTLLAVVTDRAGNSATTSSTFTIVASVPGT
jgi:VCBS repeat-containing protein